MDVRVFNTTSITITFLIRFALIFNCINMNGIKMKSFYEVSQVHFSLFSTLSPLKSKRKVHFCVLWEFNSSLSL